MPTSTAERQTQLQIDPEPELTISDTHLEYIQSLNESPTCYSRFFDALLINKSSHSDFFYDLKTFREQSAVITLLEPGTREAYRECTTVFLGSRFAHPWCRTSAAHSSGRIKANWTGRTKKLDAEAKKEEEKLHRLLVPIWIAFQRRMFPEQHVIDEWVDMEEERKKERELLAREKEDQAALTKSDVASTSSTTSSVGSQPVYRELGFATGPGSSSKATSSQNHATDGSGAAAANVFLGAAVTGFIMSDKRVKKYVTKKLSKK
ncbi:hypothetical protein PV10_07242 [Exophiala mesophila]|uniref:Uncharacterized protein n=1 Tax=Exophiala mesophila TaxID=212818 RepID=A0A0D1Z7F3_EXOME|nr:uncharacterized protein PV10_07242 [Exophiala mesophila]KIV89874.1 hypothetical protein PV10_07242 [Exophiala mesophila]